MKKEGKISKEETEKICQKVLEDNKQAVGDFKQGKKESLNFLLGEVMKKSNKRADFSLAREILFKLLK